MNIKEPLKNLLAFIVAFIAFCLSKLIWLTCTKEKLISREFEDLEASNKPFIYSVWHGRLFAFYFLKPKHRKVFAIVSRHGDGQFIADMMKFCGMDSIRGSANSGKNEKSKRGAIKSDKVIDRGGAYVIREAIKTLKRGHCVAVTPDGPKGPRFKFKNNFLQVAALAKVPLVVASYSATRAWVIPSWDRFIIPKPFSKIKIIYGEPMYIPRLDSEAEIEKYGQQVETALNDITSKLDEEFNIKLD